ncbi:uncharacterized protein LOC126671269 [Mercurialis annua]|uniref:uncharacterized protein LOC126671269 n=1 Tax=Mercurialis annua TaxID=3986 RepID=UPI00215F23FB|nr:uncharacterized protein LOC126671269 [Mercurialis annua]
MVFSTIQPFPFPQFSLTIKTKTRPVWVSHHGLKIAKTSQSWMVCAVDKDSEQFEIDPIKAQEALQQLDRQLQDLSNKKISPPKIKASNVKLTRDETTEQAPEVSGSVLAILGAVLLLYTIFYNILYLTVIDPPVR